MHSIYIIAGEASGDVLGGRLMHALNNIKDSEPVIFSGIGGTTMEEAGLTSLFPMQELSLMGIFEVVPKLPKVIKRVYQTVRDIEKIQPDIVITIDAPDFNKAVVKRARKKCPHIKFVHYVAPTVWAWRKGRAKQMAKLFDGLICLFPFEPPYFEKEGLTAVCCGHPAIEAIPVINAERQNDHILIFPGSRLGEIKRIAPVFRDVYQKMKAMNPDLRAHIVAFSNLKEDIEEEFFGLNVKYIDPKDRYKAMTEAPFALAKSGTTGIELAIAKCPHIIAYKMNSITWEILIRVVKTKYAHIVNIMYNKEVVPEFIQYNCVASKIMHSILHHKSPDFGEIRLRLAGDNPEMSPSKQAAYFVKTFL